MKILRKIYNYFFKKKVEDTSSNIIDYVAKITYYTKSDPDDIIVEYVKPEHWSVSMGIDWKFMRERNDKYVDSCNSINIHISQIIILEFELLVDCGNIILDNCNKFNANGHHVSNLSVSEVHTEEPDYYLSENTYSVDVPKEVFIHGAPDKCFINLK